MSEDSNKAEPNKACPFCGERRPDRLEVKSAVIPRIVEGEITKYWIFCFSCAGQGGWGKSETMAWSYWNMRDSGLVVPSPGLVVEHVG